MKIVLAQSSQAIPFVVEECAFEGVKRILGKVAGDVEKVSGVRPQIMEVSSENYSDILAEGQIPGEEIIFAATLGKSELLEDMIQRGVYDPTDIRDKWEVFALKMVENPFPGVKRALVICGSDKRGTIYGLFRLSEYMGVTPMCYWGDAEPEKRSELIISDDIEIVSKEPSVKYRGFFINDEWPCFGTWTTEHFGGFTAEMYDHVFEFLLRMKGNYLWPAMWTSSFPLDGPGSLNEELADIYGVVIGFSHHEPCLRASEEWDLVRGEESVYGNEWNFHTNGEGLTRYWGDGLKRSGKYEHLVTIGMRGERDSSMLGPDASLQDNIGLLKEIITTQRKLIGKYINADVDSVPQLLALYKEVEAYFYGDEHTEGLKNWDELENVIFMLCEDNFGYMRTLPTPEMRKHKGGYGMYYHFDYHGSPISYEWMPSTTLAKTWEQMTQAYDFGIRDVWIVNVGDLKGNEIALQYFLSLAYDYDKWGSACPGSYNLYLKQWAKQVFPQVSEACREQIADVYTGFVELNALRRPEAQNADIYHPCHYLEADRILDKTFRIDAINEAIYNELTGNAKQAYWSMLYFPAKASMNLLRMNLYAGKNKHYANQGRKAANKYAKLVEECIAADRELVARFGVFRDGKWKGMELEQHIGFTKWNDDGWKYPVRMLVEPVTAPRMSVSRADEARIAVKNYGALARILVDDFMSEGITEVLLEISNDGVGSLDYRIMADGGQIPSWLEVSSMEGRVEELEKVRLICHRELLPREQETVRLLIQDGDTTVAVIINAQNCQTTDILPKGYFTHTDGVIVMEAPHYISKKDVGESGYTLIPGCGRSGNGMKVLPCTQCYMPSDEKPEITYGFYLAKAGDYRVEVWTSPSNSLVHGKEVALEIRAGEAMPRKLQILSPAYRGGEPGDRVWSKGVLDHIRVTETVLTFEQGLQTLTIGALSSGVMLERILIYPADQELKQSYLGPVESYYKK
ncbi:MAG: glycosyl hydrolase 115 family protein [Lachnospiraceae bacterium]|nr:glycosyl hydrolase 115 family protein [Lachnospiraceae bacterium]